VALLLAVRLDGTFSTARARRPARMAPCGSGVIVNVGATLSLKGGLVTAI
jgi:hypothetical protein